MNDCDVIVIGNGLFGSAAARHLSELGNSVVVIGPDEPADPATHQGVFASHYDQGRLTRLLDRSEAWAQVTRRAVSNYAALEQASGIRFHSPVGCLVAALPEAPVGQVEDALGMVRQSGIEHTFYEPGDKSWQEQFPYLDFADTHYVIHEPAPAGFINPRKLIQAQNVVAGQHGADFVGEVATSVAPAPDGAEVSTATGSTYRARKVLVAAGAFSNFNNLLAESLPLRLKTEIVVLARVSAATAQDLSGAPTVKYMIDSTELDGIYMVPPVRYPDGNLYIKAGANTPGDTELDTLEDVQAWFRTEIVGSFAPVRGKTPHNFEEGEAYADALGAMWPGVEFLSFDTKRCIVAYTPSDNPIIKRVDESVFVAAGGNGAGAKASDAWGELAAGLVHDGRWPPEMVCLTS